MFTADVQTAFLNAHTKDGDVLDAKTATRVAAEPLDPQHRSSDLETAEKSLWSEERTETLARPSRTEPQEVRLRPEHAWHLLVDSHDEASITRLPRGRLVVGWNAPNQHRSRR